MITIKSKNEHFFFKKETNDVGARDIAVDDSQSDDFSVTSVTVVLLELILE